MLWQSTITNATSGAIITQSGIYIISENNPDIQISYLSKYTGNILWQFSWSNINTNYIRETNGNLYFTTKNSRSLVMLDQHSPHKQIKLLNLRTLLYPPPLLCRMKQIFISLWTHPSKQILEHMHEFIIHSAQKSISKNTIYEITITHDDSTYQDKQKDLEIQSDFISPQKTIYHIKGFYYDKDTWKVRFTPDEAGDWTWNMHIQNRYASENTNGSFTALNSPYEGFIKTSTVNPQSFVVNNIPFYPIGIQDCVKDYNDNGDPLDQWFPGISDSPPYKPSSALAYSMESYLSLYKESGFNLWRWGSGNCSFTLWKQFSPEKNLYDLNAGIRIDTLFQTLREHKFHVWMSLFSFTLPFSNTVSSSDKNKMIRDYLDYIVARYASYVDVWELGNEIPLDTQTIEYMSKYIRSIDPYQHNITTSWEHPEIHTIDITSLHWYDTECDDFCNKNLETKIAKFTYYTKPIVFSEQGNHEINWNSTSADRMRVRLWLSYMQNVSIIFWNTSMQLYSNTAGTSNIYLGPTERLYISIFNHIIHQTDENTETIQISSLDDTVKISGRSSKQFVIVYLYRKIKNPEIIPVVFQINVPFSGIGWWIDPKTGKHISQQYISSGEQTMRAPVFGTDLVFTINAEK
jgi:hypothetical protein